MTILTLSPQRRRAIALGAILAMGFSGIGSSAAAATTFGTPSSIVSVVDGDLPPTEAHENLLACIADQVPAFSEFDAAKVVEILDQFLAGAELEGEDLELAGQILAAASAVTALDCSTFNLGDDLNPLVIFTGLESLNVSGTATTDLSFVQKMTGLETLVVANNVVDSLGMVDWAELTSLKTIDITGAKGNEGAGLTEWHLSVFTGNEGLTIITDFGTFTVVDGVIVPDTTVGNPWDDAAKASAGLIQCLVEVPELADFVAQKEAIIEAIYNQFIGEDYDVALLGELAAVAATVETLDCSGYENVGDFLAPLAVFTGLTELNVSSSTAAGIQFAGGMENLVTFVAPSGVENLVEVNDIWAGLKSLEVLDLTAAKAIDSVDLLEPLTVVDGLTIITDFGTFTVVDGVIVPDTTVGNPWDDAAKASAGLIQCLVEVPELADFVAQKEAIIEAIYNQFIGEDYDVALLGELAAVAATVETLDCSGYENVGDFLAPLAVFTGLTELNVSSSTAAGIQFAGGMENLVTFVAPSGVENLVEVNDIWAGLKSLEVLDLTAAKAIDSVDLLEPLTVVDGLTIITDFGTFTVVDGVIVPDTTVGNPWDDAAKASAGLIQCLVEVPELADFVAQKEAIIEAIYNQFIGEDYDVALLGELAAVAATVETLDCSGYENVGDFLAPLEVFTGLTELNVSSSTAAGIQFAGGMENLVTFVAPSGVENLVEVNDIWAGLKSLEVLDLTAAKAIDSVDLLEPLTVVDGLTIITNFGTFTVVDGVIVPVVERGVTVFAGTNRFDTAAKTALAHFPNGVDRVYIANAFDGQVDALTAAAAAGASGSAVLYVDSVRNVIPAATMDAIAELKPSEIVVLGGIDRISDATATTLAAINGSSVERIAGGDRFETSAKLAASDAFDGVDTVYIANGLGGQVDALTGAAAAANSGSPVLLINDGDVLPVSIVETLSNMDLTNVYVLGNRISANVKGQLETITGAEVTRLAGNDRFETAQKIAEHHRAQGTFAGDVVYVTNGLIPGAGSEDFADALAAAAASGIGQGPLMIVDNSNNVPAGMMEQLAKHNPNRIIVLGGTNRVSQNVIDQLTSFIG